MPGRISSTLCAVLLLVAGCGGPTAGTIPPEEEHTGPGEVLGTAIGRHVTIRLRDGTTLDGELTAIGRSDQWGEADWYPTHAIDVDGGDALRTVGLDRVAALTSRSARVIDGAILCDYEEGSTTVVVWCTLTTPMSVELVEPLADGGRLVVDDTYVWRFEVDGAEAPLERPLGAIFVRATSTRASVEALAGTDEAAALHAELRETLRRRWLSGIESIRFGPRPP